MKTILIKEVKYSEQAYPTVGNYEEYEHHLLVEVSKLRGYVKNEDELLGVAIHELVEMLLCRKRRVSFEAITDWDIWHKDVDAEPGEIRGAPYFREHAFANKIEKLFLKELQKDGKRHR